MKHLSIYTVLAVSCLVHLPGFAEEPVGFERWNPLPSSYVEFGRTCGDLQKEYNHPGGFSPGSSSTQHTPGGVQTTADDNVDRTKQFRLSDIEVRFDYGTDQNVLDAVVVTNTGSWQRASWLACGLTQTEVHQWTQVKWATLLDVERYHNQNGWFWAAIIQLNPFDVRTYFLPANSLEAIENLARNFYGARVVDIDFLGFMDSTCGSSPSRVACGGVNPYFSAIMVGNSGDNEMEWELDRGSVAYDPHALVDDDFQLVDRERYNNVNPSPINEARLSIKKDNSWDPLDDQTQADVHHWNHSSYGVVVDLEWEEEPGAIGAYEWYTVNTRQF